MSRLDYHGTYMDSVRSQRLPHFRTSFDSQAGTRHPLDYKYDCGFDPLGKTLKQCADHWRTCKSAECQTKAQNWADLKDEIAISYRLKGRH